MSLPRMITDCRLACACGLAIALFLGGCAPRYFREAEPPGEPVSSTPLERLPYGEYWSGIVFNGARIGFSHFTITPAPDSPEEFVLRSEAVFRIRFLMFDKAIRLKSVDRITKEMRIVEFAYDYDLDGNRKELRGRWAGDRLRIRIQTRGRESETEIFAEQSPHPTSVIGIYPFVSGLAIGRHYEYPVFDGETGQVSRVTQEVVAYEESDLFIGRAHKIRTQLHGQEVLTWMDNNGLPLLEMSMGGVIIAELETEERARQYLAEAALNKQEALLDFSRIKTDRSLSNPEGTRFLEVALTGIRDDFIVPSDERQDCERIGDRIVCKISADGAMTGDRRSNRRRVPPPKYLAASTIIPSDILSISGRAEKIAGDTAAGIETVQRLVDWIAVNIKKEPVDVFTALDVLETGKAECQGHAYLYAAFARSLGIPTRVVNGIVYSADYDGFLYHTWAESWVDDAWTAIDPTFAQVPADATHIKLIEGEKTVDLLPMVNLIGNLHATILRVEP